MSIEKNHNKLLSPLKKTVFFFEGLKQMYMFVQVIEVFIRSEEGLSRDMVKHLNSIEEQVLESKAWTRDSALWTALNNANNKVPTVEEVHTYTHTQNHFVGWTYCKIVNRIIKAN